MYRFWKVCFIRFYIKASNLERMAHMFFVWKQTHVWHWYEIVVSQKCTQVKPDLLFCLYEFMTDVTLKTINIETDIYPQLCYCCTLSLQHTPLCFVWKLILFMLFDKLEHCSRCRPLWSHIIMLTLQVLSRNWNLLSWHISYLKQR